MSAGTIGLIAVAVVLGIVNAVLPLGPVTVLVVRRALAGDKRGALAIGLGRIVPEGLYCGFAAFGVTALLDRFSGVRLGIEALGTVLFLALGAWLWFQEPRAPMQDGDGDGDGDGDAARKATSARRRWGAWSGFIISLLNPTLILTWSAGIAIALSMLHVEPTIIDKLLFPIALGVGFAAGYLILIAALSAWGEHIGDRFLRWVLRGMAVVFVGTAIANAVRMLSS